ncbi:unnamed protein product [Coregonus sp. 'balchen']|nr:unnamed protein product [Coregonus sp. 'balchen']
MTKLVDRGAQFSALGVGIPRQHEPGGNDLRLGISPYGETSHFADFNLIAACQDIAPAKKSQLIAKVSGYAAALGSRYGGHFGSHGYTAIDSRNFTFTYRTPDIIDSAARDTPHGFFSRTSTGSVRIPPSISENPAHTLFSSIGEQSASPNGYMANSRAHLGTQRDIYVGADPHQPVSIPHFSDTQLHFDHNVDMGMRVATQNGHGAFFRYMRQPSKQDVTCKWIDENQTNQPQKTCGNMFCSMFELVTHVSMDHVGGPEQGEKPFKCEFEGCDRRFANSSDRKKHMHVHTSDKPYICKVHKSQTSGNSPTGTSGYESSTPPAPCRPTSSTTEDSTKTSMLLVKSIFKEDLSTKLVEWYV